MWFDYEENKRFNPRSREGSDLRRLLACRLCRPVSIHAPVKGATGKIRGSHVRMAGFNPRSREGSDQTDPI